MSTSQQDTPKLNRIVVLISGSGKHLFLPPCQLSPSSRSQLLSSELKLTLLLSRTILPFFPEPGSNLQSLINATLASPSPLPNSHIAHVISNRSKAYGLTRCSESSPPIPTSIHNLKSYLARPTPSTPSPTRETYDVALADLVLSTKPDLVVLAGFMHILSPAFLGPLGDVPIINLHPALPGMFDGANAIPRALEAFEKGEVDKTGAMVHRVVEEVDQGEPIIVREVEIKKGEGLEALEERIHKVEHEIIVEGARKVLQEMGRI